MQPCRGSGDAGRAARVLLGLLEAMRCRGTSATLGPIPPGVDLFVEDRVGELDRVQASSAMVAIGLDLGSRRTVTATSALARSAAATICRL